LATKKVNNKYIVMSKRENNGNNNMKDTSVRVTGNKRDAWRMKDTSV